MVPLPWRRIHARIAPPHINTELTDQAAGSETTRHAIPTQSSETASIGCESTAYAIAPALTRPYGRSVIVGAPQVEWFGRYPSAIRKLSMATGGVCPRERHRSERNFELSLSVRSTCVQQLGDA